jgi:hypothetical protein
MSTTPTVDLLEGLDVAVEQVRLLCRLAHVVIDAMQRGERLPDAILVSYIERLERADTGAADMQRMIATMWAMHGQPQPH